MTIGLAGGYCAGKNAVEALLRERGFTCFDLDRIGHEALAIRVIRGCARDGLRIRDVLARIWSQRSFRKELRLLGRPLRPLWNDGDRRTLEDRLERLLMAGSSTRAAVPASDAASAKPST